VAQQASIGSGWVQTSRSTGLAGPDVTCRFREQQSQRQICAVLSLMPVARTSILAGRAGQFVWSGAGVRVRTYRSDKPDIS
jgi:hypothetical protein